MLMVFVLLRALGFDGFFGQDSYEYLRLSRQMQASWLENAPVAEAIYPPGYPFLGAVLGLITGSSEWGLSMVSLLAGLLSLWFFRQILDLLYQGQHTEKTIFTLLVLLVSPAFLKASQVAMSDMCALCLVLGTVFLALQYDQKGRSALLFAAASLAALAVSVRIATLVVLPFPVLFLAWKSFEKKHFLAWIGSVLTAVILLVGLFQLQHFSSLLASGHPYSPDHWNPANFFRKEFHSYEGNMVYTLPNLVFVTGIFYHKAFQFWGGIYLVFLLRNWKSIPFNARLLWLPVVAYLLFMAGLSVQNERYLLLVFPLALILVFPGFVGLVNLLKQKKLWIPALALHLAMQLFLNYRSLRGPVRLSAFEKNMAADLQPFRNQKVYSFSVDVALQQRIPGMEFLNLWEKRYGEFDPDAMVLFNETEFAKDWAGQNPMLNWEKLQNDYRLRPVKSWPDGWALYEID
ncbi:MAG TPA: glycosyltransferase family 39 protein [Catalimonadaceae bacterium]|nr:glycosyltransferase family 39 protein [Catalimonadaceae bacterium]